MQKNIKIENQTFEVRHNVKSQSAEISTSELFFEYYDSNATSTSTSNNNSVSFFLLFETCFDGAFSHWVYESAIYLYYFFELKSEYPELKLLVKKNPKRSYKNLFFKALNISDNDIHWIENKEFDDCKTVYNNIPIHNVCINTTPHYMNMFEIPNKDDFKELIIKFRNKIMNNLNITYPAEKTLEHLFFPRSKLENNVQNDRRINYDTVYKVLQGKQYVEYDTINTKNLKDQIELLISSKNVFLDWGSSMLVNGLFCKDSTILISSTLEHQRKYRWFSVFFEISMENNNNQFIKIY
jgi:hypothetical protein